VVKRRLTDRVVNRPQQLWLRRALFQVHLWSGLIVGLYIFVIGLSGSILVFKDDLEQLGRSTLAQVGAGPQADILSVAGEMQKHHPGATLYTVLTPSPERPVFRGYLQVDGALTTIDADAVTGRVLPASRWQKSLNWIENLHIFLLAGDAGLIANGVGAVCLFLLSITGLLIWWPGVRRWKRALVVRFHTNWKRVNFDLHNVGGFWPLALILFWSVSGIYFTWPAQVTRTVDVISPVISAAPPKYEMKPGQPGARTDMRAVLAQAAALTPHASLAGIGLSNSHHEPIVVDMARGEQGDLLQTDYLYFHPSTGEHLATWHYGANQTAGDWIIWLMHPLHFGTSWGIAVKILWAALGLSLPLLAITGALMYWNRYLRRKLRTWLAGGSPHASRAEPPL